MKINLRKFLVLVLLVFTGQHAMASPLRDTVRVGLFVENLYDLNFTEQSFKSDYWIWFNYKNDSISLPGNIEIIKNKNIFNEFEIKGKLKELTWSERKIKAELVKNWNITNYPFDRQTLVIETEIIDKDTNALCVLLDTTKCGIDKNLMISDWKIEKIRFRKKVNQYETDFGDPTQTINTFYSVIIEADIKRDVVSLFFKLFIGVFIAAAIALSSLFIKPKHSDPRYGLPVGSLFAAVGNKYIVDSIIPQTSSITLVDKIHFLTFFLIMMVIVTSIISQKYYESHKKLTSWRVDRVAFAVLSCFYILVILFWT